MLVWVEFTVCLGIILLAGTRLSKYGDILAEKTGLGQVWVGMVLLAIATSLPELVTGISSVTLVGEPDLTAGDLFGSCIFNLVIITLVDMLYRRGSVLSHASQGIAFSAAASALLIALVGASIYVTQNVFPLVIFNHVGLCSVIIFTVYLGIQWMLANFERKQQLELVDQELEKVAATYGHISSRKACVSFSLSALAIIGAGIWLSFIGDRISEITGLETSFVGSLFVALSTSLPEIVVTISALRLGAVNMAVGNVIGSNMFNMGVVIFIDDLFYTRGPFLSHISSNHIFTAFMAIVMTCVVIVGLTYRSRRWPRAWISFDTAALLLLCIGTFWVLFLLA